WLHTTRERLGRGPPVALPTVHGLTALYQAQGRYGEAEPLFREALQASREVLGPRHPLTLSTQLRSAGLSVNRGRREEAVRTLQQMEPHLLGWIGPELYRLDA